MKILKEGADKLPKSYLPSYYAINLMNDSPEPLPANIVFEIEKLIKKENNGKFTSGMAYCKVILKNKIGQNAFTEAINFLKSYPNADFKYIKGAIEIARESLPFDKPELVKNYYNMLLVLAIKQPGTKDRLKVIGLIINEKKKLETIMPELRNP